MSVSERSCEEEAPVDNRLLTKICRWYYEDNQTQDLIAQRIGVSRSTVSRLLTQSRNQGLVKVHIQSSVEEHSGVELERALEQLFCLDEAVVVDPADRSASDLLGAAASETVLRMLDNDMLIGISWGRTLAAFVAQMPVFRDVRGITFVSLSGGVGSDRHDILSNTLVLQLAEKLYAQVLTLNAPAIVQDQSVHQALIDDPAIARVLEKVRQVDMAVVGIGAVGAFSTLSTMNYLNQPLLDELTQSGAVGDICSRFYTIEGNPVISEIDRRTIGIDLPSLKKVPRVIGLGWGEEKIQALIGALRMGVLNVLVTDRKSAAEIVRISTK